MSILDSQTAMILAAGLGTRLSPLTKHTPKPLVKISGLPILDHIINLSLSSGIKTFVVNIHHLSEQIKSHLEQHKDINIIFSDESKMILETGGGIKRALPLLGSEAFYVINGDVILIDGPKSALSRLSSNWRNLSMDGLLLLQPTDKAIGYSGVGDFLLHPSGQITRPPPNSLAPYIFTGIQILHPRIFQESPDGAFSLNIIYNQTIKKGRLFGLVHDADWLHVGDMIGLKLAEKYFANY